MSHRGGRKKRRKRGKLDIVGDGGWRKEDGRARDTGKKREKGRGEKVV